MAEKSDNTPRKPNPTLDAPPPPPSPLGRHRLLAPSAGVRVSPICLGAMNFGESWKPILGECDKKTSFAMMDLFYDMGGNFIDTANSYQNGESEEWVGEWMAKRANRDEIVLATKFSNVWPNGVRIRSNFGGNHAKSIHLSVEASLRKLQTSYIDLLYVHWWDYTTDIPELMQSLNRLVTSGKVLYLGASDTPAWIVAKANQYARDHGLRPFSVYQGRWSAASRDFEREIIPMCKHEGMGIAPWGALGGGHFRPSDAGKKTEGRNFPGGGPTDAHIKVSKVLEEMAQEKNTLITSVAMAYVMHKAPYVFPICGGRKIEHLKGNIEALNLELSKEDIERIEAAVPFDLGFPNDFLSGGGSNMVTNPAQVSFLKRAGQFDFVKDPEPIAPPKL